jgi:hypothetical protein
VPNWISLKTVNLRKGTTDRILGGVGILGVKKGLSWCASLC